MNAEEYVKNAVRTQATDFAAMADRLKNPKTLQILHSLVGLATETGEIQDQLKKHIFYGRDLDKVNIEEEMGDLFWYLAVLSDALGVPFESVWEKNIAKLKARYGDKFNKEGELNRNLDKERKILEG
jgi:NTP pyrophosphatase (non-canonical NTP hydrolase)